MTTRDEACEAVYNYFNDIEVLKLSDGLREEIAKDVATEIVDTLAEYGIHPIVLKHAFTWPSTEGTK